MSRLDALLKAIVLASATFLALEWIHYRFDVPPVFQYVLGPHGPSGGGDARSRDLDAVTESEFQTYVRVLESMQANRSLSIEDAVGAEHIALDQFRELEQRVQRNDGLIDRARHILREKAESLWNAQSAQLEHG